MKFLSVIIVFATFYARAQHIALTFDDAPTPSTNVSDGLARTHAIITTLRDKQVDQVAFFVITNQIDSAGHLRLTRYAESGHLLANHTHQHQWIHRIGTREYIADIKTAHEKLSRYPGYAPWFRYPFLDEGRTRVTRDSIRSALASIGLSNGYVTIDNYDWYLNSLYRQAIERKAKINLEKLKEIYLEHIWNSIVFYDDVAKSTLGRSPKHVLLLHENDLAALFLSDLIDLIRKKGWKIISPKEAYNDPISAIVPDVLFNGQGRIGAIAFSKGMKARDLVQVSEDEQWLEEVLKREKVFE